MKKIFKILDFGFENILKKHNKKESKTNYNCFETQRFKNFDFKKS